jgi:hypothetical protein
MPMNTRKALTIGFVAGAVIGGGATFLQLAPATLTVLMKPLEWLTEGLHPYPRESLENLIIAFPLMFIYWGCAGALVALLLRVALRLLRKPEENRAASKSPDSP